MATVTIDGAAKTITLDSVGSYDVGSEIYSAWKTWVTLSDNAKFAKAFDTTGGDSISASQEISPYFFLRNDLGWIIKAAEASGETVISGNLFPRDSGSAMLAGAVGFDSFIRLEVSANSISVTSGGGSLTVAQASELSKAAKNSQIAAAVSIAQINKK